MLVLVGLALLLHLVIAHRYPGLTPFVFFYPAMLLAALLDGMWSGIAATILSALLVDYWILEPVRSFAIGRPSDAINLAVFTVFGIFLSLVIERRHRSREELAVAREEAAVQKERRKTEAAFTESKAAEEKLRESAERFRIALKNAPVSVAVQDRDLRYIWAYNQKTASPEEIIGKTDEEIFTAEEAARIQSPRSAFCGRVSRSANRCGWSGQADGCISM